jgi:hypothetical protein
MSAENDLAALQENFSFGKSRYIRNDKAAMPMRSAQRSSTYNAISFQQECTEQLIGRVCNRCELHNAGIVHQHVHTAASRFGAVDMRSTAAGSLTSAWAAIALPPAFSILAARASAGAALPA